MMMVMTMARMMMTMLKKRVLDPTKLFHRKRNYQDEIRRLEEKNTSEESGRSVGIEGVVVSCRISFPWLDGTTGRSSVDIYTATAPGSSAVPRALVRLVAVLDIVAMLVFVVLGKLVWLLEQSGRFRGRARR